MKLYLSNCHLHLLNTVPKRCPKVVIENGVIKMLGFDEGDASIFQCNNGYLLEGQPITHCLEDKNWSGRERKCKRKFALVAVLPILFYCNAFMVFHWGRLHLKLLA